MNVAIPKGFIPPDVNTVNLDAMIVPDDAIHQDHRDRAQLCEARRQILALVAAGRIRFVVCGGVKFRLERMEP